MINTNFIIPMSPMLTEQKQPAHLTNVDGQGSFKDVLNNLMNQVVETEKIDNDGIVGVTTGTADQLHDLMIASTQATTALELFVQVRNKAHDAYSEIMRMSV
ncbi:MAG: flagellar hook-basal body complex protein FliE [Peptococcaceae bacterium]|nr:flagellar hook-basal body complex protein FliE [Peptococcaceae bacterium]